jgi:hypothetical protein
MRMVLVVPSVSSRNAFIISAGLKDTEPRKRSSRNRSERTISSPENKRLYLAADGLSVLPGCDPATITINSV